MSEEKNSKLLVLIFHQNEINKRLYVENDSLHGLVFL